MVPVTKRDHLHKWVKHSRTFVLPPILDFFFYLNCAWLNVDSTGNKYIINNKKNIIIAVTLRFISLPILYTNFIYKGYGCLF